MRSMLITALAVLFFFPIFSCATMPKEPLAPGEVRLINIQVAERGEIKPYLPFMANINFESDGNPEIRTACFSFSGIGPYCYKVTDINYGSPGMIRVQVKARNSGSHALESYVYYIRDGKVQRTNVVDCIIRVIP